MRKRSREHTADEFGRPGLGSAAAIGDRALGAAPGVIVDGLVEAESGVTPGPGISARTSLVAFGVLALVAVAIITAVTVLSAPDPLPAGIHRDVWLGMASEKPQEMNLTFQLMPDVPEGEETPEWAAQAAGQIVLLIDGRTVTVGELIAYLQGGMVRADVTAPQEGVVSRIEITTQPFDGNAGTPVGADVPSDDPSLPRDDSRGRQPARAVLDLIDAINSSDAEKAYALYANPEVAFSVFKQEWQEADESYEDFQVHETRVTSPDTALVRVTYHAETTPPGGSRYPIDVEEPGEWWRVEKVDGEWKVGWLARQ